MTAKFAQSKTELSVGIMSYIYDSQILMESSLLEKKIVMETTGISEERADDRN
jgi:hypothetical protein